MPVRRRKKALEKALHERLQRLTEHLDTAEGTSQDGDRKPPAPLRVIWAGQEPEDGPP